MSGRGHRSRDPRELGELAELAAVGRFVQSLGEAPLARGCAPALEALRAVAGADACELFLYDPVARELLLAECVAPDVEAFCSRERFPLGVGFPGIVAEQARALTTCDLAHDRRFLRSAVPSRGYHSFACVPLKGHGRVEGTLHVAWRREAPPMDRAIDLLNRVAAPLRAALVASQVEAASPQPSAAGEQRAAALFAERLRLAARADAVTLLLPGPGGGLRPVVAGERALLCGGAGASGCPAAPSSGRSAVLCGDRRSWHKPCRALPRAYRHVCCLPLHPAGVASGLVIVAYHHDDGLPSTRHAAVLRSLLQWIGPPPPLPWQDTPPAVIEVLGEPVRPRLELRCLGPFAVRVDGRPIPRSAFKRQKAIELLQMLALDLGRPIPGDTVMERLWPGVNPELGLGRLHVTLHALRRAIEPPRAGREWTFVRRQGDRYLLPADGSVETDVRQMQRLLSQAHLAEAEMRPVEEVIELLERAVALYGGDLFADAPFAEGCFEPRERLREQHVNALVRLARLTAELGDMERAIHLLRRAVETDPLREDIQRALVEALWAAGRREAARRQFRRCVELIGSKLGLPPMAATRRVGEHFGVGR